MRNAPQKEERQHKLLIILIDLTYLAIIFKPSKGRQRFESLRVPFFIWYKRNLILLDFYRYSAQRKMMEIQLEKAPFSNRDPWIAQ